MRTSILIASAFAATALAKPLQKRDVIVTSIDVVYTTDVVYVTAGQQASSSAPAAAPAASAAAGQGGHRKHGHHHHSSAPQAPAPTVKSSTTEAPAPTSEAPPPTSEAPAPVTTTQAPAPTTQAPAPVETSTSSSAPQTTASSSGVASTYQQAVVDHHNYHRANHSATAITWSQEMADIAMSIAKTCVYAHNMTASKTPYGQNIAAGQGAAAIASIISDQFYNGEVGQFTGYGQAQPSMVNFEAWGHFSQVVWKGTTGVGCATWDCGSDLVNFNAPNGRFTVCNYSPPGNYEGEYGSNIGNSQNEATIPGSYNINAAAIASSYGSAIGQTIST